MTPRVLWIPFEVEDLDQTTHFYTDRIPLSAVDGWAPDGERGVVPRIAERAVIEPVSPEAGHPPPLAVEHADESEVDSVWWAGAGAPHRHPRGHYGFTARGPAGMDAMLRSER